MRDDINLGRGNLEDVLEKLRRVLAHHNEPIREFGEFNHYAMLVGVGFAQYRMKRRYDRHAEIPQQFQDVASRGPTENSVFVLHAYQVDIGEIEELGCLPIRWQLLFGQLKADPLGIAVLGVRIVDRQRE